MFFPLFELNKLSHYVKLKQSAKFHSQPHTALHECIIIIEKGIPVIFDTTGLIPKAYARPRNTCAPGWVLYMNVLASSFTKFLQLATFQLFEQWLSMVF